MNLSLMYLLYHRFLDLSRGFWNFFYFFPITSVGRVSHLSLSLTFWHTYYITLRAVCQGFFQTFFICFRLWDLHLTFSPSHCDNSISHHKDNFNRQIHQILGFWNDQNLCKMSIDFFRGVWYNGNSGPRERGPAGKRKGGHFCPHF